MFGPQCKTARRKYHLAKKRYNQIKSPAGKNNLIYYSKEYKKTMDKFISKYRKDTEKKLRKMQSSKPKDYWKLLNSLKSHSTKNTPSIDEFLEHFKLINQTHHHEEETINFESESGNEFLNARITRDEILRSINKLKNGKTSGFDSVVNEYIKSTKQVLLPVYETLFNIILDTGFFPEQWTVGIIKPIYKNKGDINDVANFRPITILSYLRLF